MSRVPNPFAIYSAAQLAVVIDHLSVCYEREEIDEVQFAQLVQPFMPGGFVERISAASDHPPSYSDAQVIAMLKDQP